MPTAHCRVASAMNDESRRDLRRPRTASPLESAYAYAVNARDHAKDRFEAMDFCEVAFQSLDMVTDYTSASLVREVIGEAKHRWDL